MENYDQRRRQNEERERARFEDRGRDRDSWWRGRPEDDDPPRRERGWLDYDRDYGRSSDRPGGGREEHRGGQAPAGSKGGHAGPVRKGGTSANPLKITRNYTEPGRPRASPWGAIDPMPEGRWVADFTRWNAAAAALRPRRC